jgi:hypothetical protein
MAAGAAVAAERNEFNVEEWVDEKKQALKKRLPETGLMQEFQQNTRLIPEMMEEQDRRCCDHGC